MSSPKPQFSLPVVAAEEYRHAVAGEPWELCPVAITGPIQYRSSPRDDSFEATRHLAEISLRTPLDYPTISDAILAGDHVALAVDPNVPRVAEVIAGVLEVLKSCRAGRVSIVLWSEASDSCYQSLTQRFQTAAADDFADWSTDQAWARKLGELLETNRVFLHSELDDADVESLGIGIVSSVEELHRLGQTCQAAGMLRAAQFQASTVARSETSAEES